MALLPILSYPDPRLHTVAQAVKAVDDRIREESADVTAHLNNGETIHLFVEHAIGSLQRPMTDANLEAKLTHLSAPVLGDARTRPLIDACWQLGHADNVHSLVSAMRV